MSLDIISLIIMGVTILLWVTGRLPSSMVALIGCLAMAVCGICTLPEAMAGFTNDIIFLVVGMQVIGNALFATGAAQRIGYVTVKLAKDNEKRFLLYSCLAAGLMSAFLSDSTVVMLFMTICISVSSVSKTIHLQTVAIPVSISAIIGGTCTLVGSTPQLAGQSVLQELGGEVGFSMFDFTPVALPLLLLYVLYSQTVGYWLGRRIWGNRQDAAPAELTEKQTVESSRDWNKAKATQVLIILGVTVIAFACEVLTLGTVAMLGALACVCTGCLPHKQAFTRMNWDMIIWLAGCFGLANALKLGGGTTLLADWCAGCFSASMSPFVIFAVITLVSMLLTQVMINTTVVMVLLPLALTLTQSLGINPYAVTMGVIMGASLAFGTPIACAHIGFTLSAGYRFTDYLRYGWPCLLLGYVAVLLLVPLFYPL